MPVYYIDGQSQGNEQNSLPRKAKIAIAYAESDTVDHGKFRIYWQPIGDRTNNEAEYYALLKALELIAEKATGKGPGKIGEALVRSDSKLVVNQVNGEWRGGEEKIFKLRSHARGLIKKGGPAPFGWGPPEGEPPGLWVGGEVKAFSVGANSGGIQPALGVFA